jgi:hypothetical protein
VSTRAGKVESVLGKLTRPQGRDVPKDVGRWEVAVLDPPRRGLGHEAARRLSSLLPSRIVYISCDPATLARALEVFVSEGDVVERVRVFDLMPMTSEVEIVTTLQLPASVAATKRDSMKGELAGTGKPTGRVKRPPRGGSSARGKSKARRGRSSA